MREISTARVREALADELNRVLYLGERLVLLRHGKQVAAVVSIADLAQLEGLATDTAARGHAAPAEEK